MPSIRKPSAQEIKAHPREFALFQQLVPGAAGKPDDKAFIEFLNSYGKNGHSPAFGAEVTFEEFAALFSKPSTYPGEGNTLGWAAQDKSGKLAPYRFDRRPVGPRDIHIQITHAGICHSDIHQVKDEWGGSLYPQVPGHEIVGIVTEVGPEVTAFKVGDRAGVGCMVWSCQDCKYCKEKAEEQFCSKAVWTYNARDWRDGSLAQGGYSTAHVVDERFAIKVPDSLPLDKVAPLLCAGITTYSPLRKFGLDKPGLKLGVVGLGGLGHMAVKFGKAFGCHVTVISTSPSKQHEAMQVLGADAFLVSKDAEAMAAAASTLDGIIDTVSAPRDLTPLFNLLPVDGKYINLGAPPVADLPKLSNVHILKRIMVSGSVIGGIAETQEMIDFCAQHNITPLCETIPISQVNEAYQRVLKSDVRYRFVIDVQGSLIA